MAVYADGIEAASYDYELPDGIENHTANSNATILSVLNEAGVDLRRVPSLPGASSPYYVDSYFGNKFPGASNSSDPTLLGATNPQIEASVNQRSGVVMLGRDTVDDVSIGTAFADRYFGEQANFSDKNDTVTYERLPSDLRTPNDGLTIRVTRETVSGNPYADQPVGVHGVNSGADANKPDLLYGIEMIELTSSSDTVIVTQSFLVAIAAAEAAGGSLAIDARSNAAQEGDVLDFSRLQSGFRSGPTSTKTRFATSRSSSARPRQTGSISARR